MNKPNRKPNPVKRDCSARDRRQPAKARASLRARQQRSRDACPARTRMLDPEHEAFVAWFVLYWRSHGARLLTSKPTTGKEA
jgi:hypothetical protein